MSEKVISLRSRNRGRQQYRYKSNGIRRWTRDGFRYRMASRVRSQLRWKYKNHFDEKTKRRHRNRLDKKYDLLWARLEFVKATTSPENWGKSMVVEMLLDELDVIAGYMLLIGVPSFPYETKAYGFNAEGIRRYAAEERIKRENANRIKAGWADGDSRLPRFAVRGDGTLRLVRHLPRKSGVHGGQEPWMEADEH